jgi:tetratricopeptide (TPR) repeat protein
MTNQEIEEILEQAKQALDTSNYREAEILASKIINTDLSSINYNEKATVLLKAYRFLALSFLKRGLIKQSQINAQKALTLSIEVQNKEEKAIVLSLLGTISCRFLENKQGIEYYQQAIELYQELDIREGIVKCNINLGFAYSISSQYPIALEYYNKALEDAKILNLKQKTAYILGNIGITCHVQSDYFKALEYYRQAVAIHQELGNMSDAGIMIGNIGSAYREIADYRNALECYEKAIAIYDEFGMLFNKTVTITNIGITYRSLLDYPRAIEYLEKSVAMYEELGMKDGVAMSIGNIGITYSQMSDYHNAMEYLLKAYSMYQELAMEVETAIFASNLGKAYYDLADYPRALEFLEMSLLVFQKVGRREEATCTKSTIGLVYASPNFSGFDPQKAETLILESIKECEELGAKLSLYQAHQSLAMLYKQQKRWEEYSTHYEKFHELYAEVQNEGVKKQADRLGWERKIAEMEKQKEIETIKAEAEKAVFEQKMELQARELDAAVKSVVQKNSFLQQIQSDIKKIRPYTYSEGLPFIEKLLKRLERNAVRMDSESDGKIAIQWEEIHGKYMKNLKLSYPKLTEMELKVAALLNMKFTSSNISAALYVSMRTIESHRYSLRKKIGLSAGDDIYKKLAQYSLVTNNFVVNG